MLQRNDVYRSGMEYLRRQASEDMLCFTLFTKRDYIPNWHHRILCEKLNQFARNEINRLMVFMPPQAGKSELTSRRFPAFLFGRNPDERIIACSSTTSFAQTLSRDVQRIIDSDAYRQVFPDVCLNRQNVKTNALGNYIRTAERFEIVGWSGTYKSGGVGSSISGNPATTLILDDPFGSFGDAQSVIIRERVWNWFFADFMARRSSENARIIIIQTRWHEDDLAGRILAAESDNWNTIIFPAICEENKAEDDPRSVGEPLWPERFSIEEIERTKMNLGSYMFSAVYQQTPSPSGGGIFKRSMFKYFNIEYNIINTELHHYELSSCKFYACLDLAIKEKESADYTVAVIFALSPDSKIFIVEVIRERFDAVNHLDFVKGIIEKWNCVLVGIESTQYQTTLLQQCIRDGLNVKELKPDKDKLTRALPMQAKLESGIVYFLKDAYWLGDFENELMMFPNGKYDDQVDAFAYIEKMLAPLRNYKWPFATKKPTNGNGKENIIRITDKLERAFK